MKKLLLVGLIGLGGTFVASAAPIDCATLGTMAALQAAGSCATQDVLFSAFNYNAGDSGIAVGNVTAALKSLLFGGSIQVGWNFSPSGGAAWATTATAMSIGYSVRLCSAADVIGGLCFAAANALQSFTMAKAQEFPAFGPTGGPSLTNDFVGNNSTLHLPTDNIVGDGSDNTRQGSFSSGNTSVSPVLSTQSNSGANFGVQDLLIETTAPEPGTMLLAGAVLIVAGLNIRKFRRA